MQQNEKSASKLNKKAWWQIRKNKPKMIKFSQKHAQYTFRSKLKQKIATKFEETAIKKTKICKKQARKTSKISVKTSPKTSKPQVFKNTRKSTKKQAQIRRKTAGLATLVPMLHYSGTSPVSANSSRFSLFTAGVSNSFQFRGHFRHV